MPATAVMIAKEGTQEIVWAPATSGNASNCRDASYSKSPYEFSQKFKEQ
jgi:hypothetical protein